VKLTVLEVAAQTYLMLVFREFQNKTS
jgi:hypothetical protein